MVLRSISFKSVFGYGVNAPFWKEFSSGRNGALMVDEASLAELGATGSPTA